MDECGEGESIASRQRNELEALTAIYFGSVEDLRKTEIEKVGLGLFDTSSEKLEFFTKLLY